MLSLWNILEAAIHTPCSIRRIGLKTVIAIYATNWLHIFPYFLGA